MEKKVEEQIRNLTQKQARVLKGISVNGTGTLNSLATGYGREIGPIAHSLKEMGLIEQVGRVNQYKRYAPTPSWEETWESKDKEEILRILNKIIETPKSVGEKE